MIECAEKSILLVEDEAILALTERMALEQCGYAVRTASSGEMAVEAVKSYPELDLILMDIDLGTGMDGTRAAEIILKDRDIPIVFVSSHSEREIVEKTEAITSYGYVVKSSSIAVLDASIKMALKLFNANNENRLQTLRLVEKNRLFENILEHFPGCVFWKDVNSVYLGCNTAEANAAGFASPAEIIGKTDSDLKWTDHKPDFYVKSDQEVMDSGKPKYHLEYSYHDYRGGLVWVNTSKIPLLDAEGKVAGVFGVAIDITERKQAESLLIKEKKRLENILLGTNVGTWEWNIQTGKDEIDEVSAAMLGYKIDELNPKTFETWMKMKHPDDLNETNELLMRHFRGETDFYSFDSRMKHKNGTWVWLQGRGKVIEWDESGRPLRMFGTHMDITERKNAEEALRASEEKHRFLVENSHDIIYTATIGGIFTFVSAPWTVLLGYPVDQVLGRSFEQFVHPHDIKGCFEWLSNAIRTGQRQTGIEYRVRHFDGSWRWHASSIVPLRDESGAIVEFEGTARDITDRKLAEYAAQDSELNYFGLFNTVKQAIYVQNPDLTFVDVNQGVVDMYGYEKEVYIGKTPEFLSAPHRNDMRQVAEFIRLAFEGYPQKFEFWGIKKDGTVFPKDVWTVKGKYFGKDVVITMANDITERKEKEEEIKSLLAEKEMLLKEVHHRVKNNMNTVTSLLSLQAHAVREPAAVAVLEEAGNRIRSMSLLYDKLYRSTDFTNVSLRDYLGVLVDEIVRGFPNAQAITIEKAIQDFRIDAKRLQPLGIITNELLSNIMKYAFTGRKSGVITVSAAKAAGRLTFIVQDDGNGIPESVSFENSSGFGLQLVQALTQQLEGSIRIERGNGTKVVLEFPLG